MELLIAKKMLLSNKELTGAEETVIYVNEIVICGYM
jgi:hypothetical protein